MYEVTLSEDPMQQHVQFGTLEFRLRTCSTVPYLFNARKLKKNMSESTRFGF